MDEEMGLICGTNLELRLEISAKFGSPNSWSISKFGPNFSPNFHSVYICHCAVQRLDGFDLCCGDGELVEDGPVARACRPGSQGAVVPNGMWN